MAALLKYIEVASETPPHRLAWLAAQIGPEAEEVYMTTADMLRAEGRAEGEAKGRAEGRAEGAARLLVRQLGRRFGAVPDGVRKRIDAASLEQLEAWSDRVLDAATLDDVFG
jgi:predicted transposase YdaD